MSDYTGWYRDGTVSLTKNSTGVTGKNTYWKTAGIKAGDMFSADNGKSFYEIASITDNTHLTLISPYAEATASGSAYAVVRNFSAVMPSEIAARTSDIMVNFKKYIDLDLKQINGKSAYEVAKDNGFTGSESQWIESLSAYGIAVQNGFTGSVSQWLESLKAAGEWSELDARTTVLKSRNVSFRNSIPSFRNKGTVFTDEHKQAIRENTYDNMFIGDNWTLNSHKYWIAKFISHRYGSTSPAILMMSDILYNAKMNETDTNEGGYANSWLHNTGLAQAEEIITADWGDMITPLKEYFPNSNASGNLDVSPTDAPHKCMIPTYRMLYGRPFLDYPQDSYSYYSSIQLPLTLFETYNGIIFGTGQQWLQECANGTDSFIRMWENGLGGSLNNHNKASASNGVRVLFFIS